MEGFMFSFLSQYSHFKTLLLFGYISFVSFPLKWKKKQQQQQQQQQQNLKKKDQVFNIG